MLSPSVSMSACRFAVGELLRIFPGTSLVRVDQHEGDDVQCQFSTDIPCASLTAAIYFFSKQSSSLMDRLRHSHRVTYLVTSREIELQPITIDSPVSIVGAIWSPYAQAPPHHDRTVICTPPPGSTAKYCIEYSAPSEQFIVFAVDFTVVASSTNLQPLGGVLVQNSHAMIVVCEVIVLLSEPHLSGSHQLGVDSLHEEAQLSTLNDRLFQYEAQY